MEPISFKDLTGKVCVITGGYGVIGRALAEGLASVQVKVALLGRSKEKADQVAAEIAKTFQATVIGVQADVLDRASLEKAKTEINEKLGPIDLLINGAGGNDPSATTKVEQIDESNVAHPEDTFYGLDPAGFDHVFALNFKGTVLPSMILTRDMLDRRKGVILNVSSMNSYNPLTKIPAYSGAKAAVNNFTQWMAVHMAKIGIRVNAIARDFLFPIKTGSWYLTKRQADIPRGAIRS